MKFYLLLAVGLFLANNPLNAQNFKKGSIVQKDKTILDGRVFIDNENQKVLFKKEFVVQKLDFNKVSSVIINGRSFSKTEIDNKPWFAINLVSGNTSLYKISEDTFIITKEDGTNKLINKKDEKLNGILAVLFKDCNPLREKAFKEDGFNQSTLIAYTTNYNSCNKTEYQPTADEIKTANRNNSDQLKVFAGAGIGSNNVSFFDSDSGEAATSVGINFGIIASPAFTGELQGNLYFGLEASANFASNIAFNNAPNPIDFSLTAYRVIFDLRYHVNKNGKIQPFVGAGLGFGDNRFKGTYEDIEFKIDGGNGFFSPKAGVLYQLKNNKSIGLTVSYIPQYDNDLSFPDAEGEIIPLIVNSEYINAGLFFYF